MCVCLGRCLFDVKEDVGIWFDLLDVGGSGLSVGVIVGIVWVNKFSFLMIG